MAQVHRGDGDGITMTLFTHRVSSGRKKRTGELPSELSTGAVQLARYVDNGVVQEVKADFRLARRGGYGGLELFAFAVLYLSAGPQSSIRAFATQHARHLPTIAAIVDCGGMPSAASVSRALSGLDAQKVDRFSDGLLEAVPGRRNLLSQPAVMHRDSLGRHWHVFDFDPSTRPFRQRDLPEHSDLPQPERRAKGVPGYMGRKRGEIRQQDHLLQHAGSGLWAFYRLNAEGGSSAPYLAGAAAAARRWMDQISHPADRTLIRADGEFGHAAAVRACTAQGLHHLVRLSRYHLFDQPEVREVLVRAAWEPVAGNRIGREAADLGTVMLYESDGHGEGVPTRVVVTRFRTDSREAGRGVVQDGFQFEMFGTSLPAEAWPADDVVALYAGRSTIENSFAQEDRELNLGRTFSYSATGQAWFVGVGLFLWNDAICRAVASLPLPATLPDQPRRPERVPPVLDEAPTEAEGLLPSPEPDLPPPPIAAHGTPPLEPDLVADLRHLMGEAAAGRILNSDWTFDPERGVLRCPTGKALHPYHAEVARQSDNDGVRGRNRIGLRSAVGACDGCPLRSSCFAGKPNTYKKATWHVSADLASRMKSVLAEPRLLAPARARPRPRPPTPKPPAVGEPLFRPLPWTTGGPLTPMAPPFSPGAARRKIAQALRGLRVEIQLRPRPRRPKRDHDLLRTPDQGTRQSWTARQSRAQARVSASVIAKGSVAACRLLGILGKN